MKEFVEKLISRLEEYQENNTQCKSSDDYELGQFNACEYAIEIVNQLAEEYNNESVNGDLISRSATIKALEEGAFVPDWNLALAQAIVSKQPTACNDGWIPCGERLPEDTLFVLCTEKDTKEIYVGWHDDIEDVGSRWFDFSGFSMDVIAWQPLPAPYQPKGE